MNRISSNTSWTVVIFAGLCLIIVCGCTSKRQSGQILDDSIHSFDIYWPPIAPESKNGKTQIPLLRGGLSIRESESESEARLIEIALTITRPTDEVGRKFWNSQLAFSDVPWMDEVRIWDSDSRWQWPNLPFLLRRHGQERVERYGGVDPGKLVDNDFAAVLIRTFDAAGKIETPSSHNSPLVSAEWRGKVEGKNDIHTVVHQAHSDKFLVHVGTKDENSSGMLKIWLIYADFLGSRPPAAWPKEREWAGGILAYTEVYWQKRPGDICRGTVAFRTPSDATGFDWEKWSDDPSSPAQSRLR